MSDAIFKLDATVRTDLGKGASRRLRHQDKVPAIIYGGDEAPVSITLEHNKVQQAQEFEAFYSHVLTINVDGKKVEALVKDMQRHPFKPKVTHIDFQRVVAGQALTTNVPIHFINEDICPAVKTGGAKINHQMTSIDIICAAGDLPEFIEIDLAETVAGEVIHLSDIKFPKGVQSLALSHGEDHDTAVVSLFTPKGVAEEEAGEEAGE